MTNLALVSSLRPASLLPSTQWVHDIRNVLAVAGLHLDALTRLAGPRGAKAADAAHALIAKVSGMCNEATAADRSSRDPFDIAATIRHVMGIIAVGAPARLAELPDIPTIAEIGLANVEFANWFGVFAPPNTAAPIVAKLNRAINKMLAQSDVRVRMNAWALSAGGAEPAGVCGVHRVGSRKENMMGRRCK